MDVLCVLVAAPATSGGRTYQRPAPPGIRLVTHRQLAVMERHASASGARIGQDSPILVCAFLTWTEGPICLNHAVRVCHGCRRCASRADRGADLASDVAPTAKSKLTGSCQRVRTRSVGRNDTLGKPVVAGEPLSIE